MIQIKSKLPEGATPLCLILYADKTQLSSFGTAKGYPVLARCANLPTELRNGAGTSGGRLLGWLPIVSIYYVLNIELEANVLKSSER